MSNKSDKRNNHANKNTTISSSKTNIPRSKAPKRVISSKKLPPYCDGGKSCSANILGTSTPLGTLRKTTKSEFIINKPNKNLDFCKKCGDALSKTTQKSTSKCTSSSSGRTSESSRAKSVVVNERVKLLDQYYKNENFRRSSESMQEIDNGFKKISLDTIKELPERRSSEVCKAKTEISEQLNEISEKETGFLDTEDLGIVKKLIEFRNKNYFECHSAKSRIENKVSAINLKDHKCTYRFYLNHRLFPVPVSTDHQDNIRCVECHLPLKLKNSDEAMKANGFIQAKIRIGNQEPQDTVMFLPVEDQLIIRERKRDDKKEEEVVYFGVIKLDKYGNSIFNQNLPSNSFALKYQKGYKENKNHEKYRLQSVNNNDVIVI